VDLRIWLRKRANSTYCNPDVGFHDTKGGEY
jgi:hypothetical protein